MGGECNYLLRVVRDPTPPHASPGAAPASPWAASGGPCRLAFVPDAEWKTPELAGWAEADVAALLDAAQAVLVDTAARLRVPVQARLGRRRVRRGVGWWEEGAGGRRGLVGGGGWREEGADGPPPRPPARALAPPCSHAGPLQFH